MQKVIDISEHNGQFDFKILKESGINRVIIRLGWIGNRHNHTKDKLLEYYYNQAIKNNMIVGFYIYSYCESIENLKEGLDFSVSLLSNLKVPITTPVFLDLEDEQISKLSKSDLTEQALYFCDYLTVRGYKPGIYANKYWFTKKLNINELNCKIWLAEWNTKKPTVNFKYDLWQYTDCEKIHNKLFDCSYIDINEEDKKEGEFEMKLYENGSTTEIVYQDINCTKQIGYLHPREKAQCYGIIEGKALIVYNIDNTDNKKSGFVKWLGGVK